MKVLFRSLALTIGLIISIAPASAQNMINGKFGDGLKVMARDSSFSMKFSTRIQSLFIAETQLGPNQAVNTKTDFLIRRARLKFSGFAYSPKVEYKIELGLTNRDHGNPIPQTSNSARLILDAVVKWEFAPNTELWVGQTKLPGNRERVISSGDLQFVDRSLLNSRYNIDRDMGLQLRHHWDLGGVIIREALAFSQGEGRNITAGNTGGYDYTGRIEVLPLGAFTDNGDYFGSDLAREERPKLSVGFTYDYHDDAARQRGNTGSFMPAMRNLSTVFADMMFKYKGFSFMGEYAYKEAEGSPVLATDSTNTPTRFFYTGSGYNAQAGYLFQNNWELAGRYTLIQPDDRNQLDDISMYTLGVSRYIVGHSLKVQGDVSWTGEGNSEELMYRLQLELSF